jgi:hypothetical protein
VQARAQINNYFNKVLPRHKDKETTKAEKRDAAAETIRQFPELIDLYIKYKEDNGDRAEAISAEKVRQSNRLYVEQLGHLRVLLQEATRFYEIAGDTYREAHERIAFLKDVIENKGGHKLFYVGGRPIEREADIHIAYRLTWFQTT